MRKLTFFLTLLIVFSVIISLSYQVSIFKPELKKIHPDLVGIKFFESERVKVIVWLNDKKSVESLEKIGKVRYRYDIVPAVAMEIYPSELENLARESNVEKIVPDRIVSAFRLESMALIKASNASSSFSVNGTGINISIIDTGIFNHTEFQAPNRIEKQKCYCNVDPGNCCPDSTAEDDNATDDHGHGTHCAGIAAGKGDGYTFGVATNSSLFAVKVLNASGSGSTSDLLNGIDWAVDNGANIISLSLGFVYTAFSDCYQADLLVPDAVDNATKLGVVVVVAAGNEGSGSGTIAAPGCAKRAITVGNSNDNDNIYSSSSRGPTDDNRTKPDLTAPGAGINSTYNNNGYATLTGTSMATPHVTGVAALILQKYNQINGYLPDPDRVKAILLTAVNTTGMNTAGYNQRNNIYGSGRIDAYEALRIINFTKNNTISAGQEHHYKINVTAADFKTTLYWPEDKDTNNDLDLFVGNGTYNFSYHTHANDSIEQYFFTDATSGYWDVYVVAATGSGQAYYLATNMNITDDATAPALTLIRPANTTYTNRTGIPINFTTDSTNNTIWYRLNGGTVIGITGNTTFDVDSDGSHYITLYVNDSWNNINQSTQYFSVDSTPPAITVVSPTSITVSNYTTKTIWFNLSLSETGNLSFCSIDSSANITMTRFNNTYFYNQSNLTEGVHNVTFYVNDTQGFVNYTSINFTISIVPSISSQTVDKPLVFLNESINISANVVEDSLEFALVNITWPDGNHTLQNMTNSSSLYYYLFNDTNRTGTYYIYIIINDTLGNRANTSMNFQVGQGINLSSEITNGTAELNLTVKIFYNGTSQTRNQTTNSSIDLILPSGLWDFFVNTSQLNVTLYNSNLTQNITRRINISDNIPGNFTADVNTIKTVALKFENFSFSIANLTFNFNPSLVSDASALAVYKCNDWNFAISNCSTTWTNDSTDATFSATNTSSNVIVTSSNFSAFLFGETLTTTTTTTSSTTSTTTPATTTVSSGGGGGGGGTTTTVSATTTSTTIPATTTVSITVTTSQETTTIALEGEKTTGVKTDWYLTLIPAFAVVGLIVWFLFLRKPGMDKFQMLKEKWSGR